MLFVSRRYFSRDIAALVCGLGAVVVLVLGLLFGLSTIQVVSAAPPEAMSGLIKAVLKNGSEIVVYFGLLVLLTVVLWRAVRKRKV